MRKVDAWAGTPVCVLLTVLRRCGDLLHGLRKPVSTPVRRILFVKLAEQGATVLAYPAIRRAVEMVGRENVHFVVFEENRFILDVLGVIPAENVVTIPTGGLGAAVVGAIRAVARLRRLKLDAAIDCEFFARSSAALAYLSGARVRVGLHAFSDPAPYRGDLMTCRLKYDPHLHTSHALAAMVEAVRDRAQALLAAPESATSKDVLPAFRPRLQELEEVRDVVQRQARAGKFRPLVLLNANASDLLPLRRWPAERYVELARRLIRASPDIRVAFTGAPDEGAVAEQLVAAVGSDRCFSMAGKTTLRELLVLYCLADLLVTNDSGPAHFATLTPIQVITLFGPETPALFGARTPTARIIWKNLPCSPCVSAYNNRFSTCADNLCMRQISVDEVFHAAIEALSRRDGSGGASPPDCFPQARGQDAR
jgi:ADP-heptose:LPS heptosyltransferase